MGNWYWSLTGGQLLAVTLGGILAVLAGACGVVVALGKLITGAADHDWRKCNHGCSQCEFRRRKSYERASVHSAQIHVDTDGLTKSHYVSTAELTPDMKVRLSGMPHLVDRVHTDIMGYIVALKNLDTGFNIIATVSFDKANRKYWEPLSPGISRGRM